jgi:branched-chain amino acid transport system permease protein
MNTNKIGRYILSLTIYIGLLFLADTFLKGVYLQLVRLFGINSIIVLGVNITNGYTNIFSLGFGGVMLTAAYTSSILTLPIWYKEAALHLPMWLERIQWPFIPALLVAGLIAVVTSVVLIFPAFRLRGHYFILASIGINIVIANLAENLRSFTQGAQGLRNIPAFTNTWWVYGTLLLTIFFIWRLIRSKFGRALIAISKDQGLAAVMGINVVRYKIYSFIIGSFIVGIGGVLWVHLIVSINPQVFDLLFVFEVIAMLAIGGIGTISGAILGAAIVTFFTELALPIQEGFSLFSLQVPPLFGLVNLLMAIILIVIMIYRPDGIMRGKEINYEHISRLARYFPKLIKK